MTSFVALSLLPALMLGSPAPNTHRVSPLLIPMDQGAEARSLKLEGYMNEALEEFPTVILKKSDELFGVPSDEEAEQALKRAEEGYTAGRVSFEATQYEDAERKLKAALREFQKSAASLRDTQHYAEALAMYAAVTLTRGDVEEAKLILLDLISLAPTLELTGKRYTKEFIQLRATVATGRNASMRGNANVRSKPSGARVFLDGEMLGYTPVTLNTVPAGKHLLRIERPGYKQYGEFVEITPEDLEINAELKPTTAYRAYDALLDKVAGELSRDKPGTAIAQLGKALGLDRALVGVVKEITESGALEVSVGLFDMHNGGRRLSFRRMVFQGDEYGQLKSEVGRLVNYLLNATEGGSTEKLVKSSDPLSDHAGTEDWGGEDRGGRGNTEKTTTKKPRYRDPLEAVNGTEEW